MNTRPASNAGVFYPAEKASILAAIAHYRHQALTCPDNIPMAIVAPHAGWQYCGPVLASAFAGVTAKTIKKIVHLGPSHQNSITGVVESRVSAFETPLGKCPVTPVSHPLVTGDFEPHRSEYSLEVQLPFMQALLGSFDYIPLLVGECAPKAIAALLNSLSVGEPGTLIIVSSDLSHYLPSAAAHSTDMITLRAIEALDPTIETAQACGAMALNGLTTLAIQKNWNPMALDRSDSSTLARTSHDSVVGYAAIGYYAN